MKNVENIKNAAIIGDGAMATVASVLLCENNANVKMWGYDEKQLMQIAEKRENVKFLPGYKIPDRLKFEPDDAKIFDDVELVVSAVPCQFVRSVFSRLKKNVRKNVPILSVTKGIENNTLMRPSEIIADVIGDDLDIAVLSGPMIADEIIRKLPATATVACVDKKVAEAVQKIFAVPYFRVYTNDDLVGVETAGAVKNVIAIAAGIVDGIKAGDNAKAALLTRGLAEITRLGVAAGASAATFAGLSGLGDLVTTCISPKGRNRSFGQRIGAGQSVEQALGATQSVVEGVATCKSVNGLTEKYGIDMPIANAVYKIIFEGKDVAGAIGELMSRQLKAE